MGRESSEERRRPKPVSCTQTTKPPPPGVAEVHVGARSDMVFAPKGSPVSVWQPAIKRRRDVRPEPPRPTGGPEQRPRRPRTRASAWLPHERHHVTEPVTSSACESTSSPVGPPTAALRQGCADRCGRAVRSSAAAAGLRRPSSTGPRAASSKALQLSARRAIALSAVLRPAEPALGTPPLRGVLATSICTAAPCMASISARTLALSLERDRAWPGRRENRLAPLDAPARSMQLSPPAAVVGVVASAGAVFVVGVVGNCDCPSASGPQAEKRSAVPAAAGSKEVLR